MTTPVAVHQFHSGTDLGDAITNQMFALQRILRSQGIVSDIYAEHIASELNDRIRPISSFEDRPATLLLVHHSMGHTAFDQLLSLKTPFVTVFHSITPAEYFVEPELRSSVRAGFRQLRRLARRSVLGIADSNHNRRQMLDAGFDRVDVMPVKTDYAVFHQVRSARTNPSDSWLFVGRLAPNKRQHRVIEAFAAYVATFGHGHLDLVGDDSYLSYVETIHQTIDRFDLGDHVTVHGKVSHDELLVRYREASTFVCLSEHEGFGVPLLEAMAAGVPVIALAAAAVSETMGGAGVLLDDDDPSTVAAVARLLYSDAALRDRMIAVQDRRLAKIEEFDVVGQLLRILEDVGRGSKRPLHVQVQGPFETSYSLAILNRNLGEALDRRGCSVSLYATEGPGDYVPAWDDLAAHPRAAELFAGRRPFPDVAIRQMFPPRVDDSDAALTFQYFGWEESGIPPQVVSDFNAHLDGIGTMSTYVRDILRDAGVTVPIEVVGVGVHQPDPVADGEIPELADLRSTCFVHISSAFPRKGVDLLLRAYYEAFDDSDDVSLILKTFPNPHNDVAEQLATLDAQSKRPPHVCWIDRDLDRTQIDRLYGVADAYVHPARGEGFGLPVAEAMLASVPVISTAAGGLADLVRPDTATVIGHRLVPADSHLSIPGSLWAEPDYDQLVNELRAFVASHDTKRRQRRVTAARQLVLTQFTWDRVAQRWAEFVERTIELRPGRDVAAVTTFNSRCGIAEYSGHLYRNMGDWPGLEIHADEGASPLDAEIEQGIRRTWRNYRSGPVDGLIDALGASTAAVTHIQYNFGFFSIHELGQLLRVEAGRRPTVLTLHRTAPLTIDGHTDSLADIADELRLCAAVIVHQRLDQQRLEEIGVTDSELIPIGTEPVIDIDRFAARRRHAIPSHAYVLGAYGFLLPHKGLLPMIRALDILRRRGIDAFVIASCAIHPDTRSAEHLATIETEIERLGLANHVRLATDYVEHRESLDLLAAADVLVLPYEHTDESSSAALRSLLPLCRPIVTSNVHIFDDVKDCVVQLPAPVEASALADALESLWLDHDQQDRLSAAVEQFSTTNSWARVSRRTRELYASLPAT